MEVVAVPTRNVVVTTHQQDLIDSLVQSGRYQNASEVLREGLRLVEQQEREQAARLAALRRAADFGWSAIAAGEFIDVDEQTADAFWTDLSAEVDGRSRTTS